MAVIATVQAGDRAGVLVLTAMTDGSFTTVGRVMRIDGTDYFEGDVEASVQVFADHPVTPSLQSLLPNHVQTAEQFRDYIRQLPRHEPQEPPSSDECSVEYLRVQGGNVVIRAVERLNGTVEMTVIDHDVAKE